MGDQITHIQPAAEDEPGDFALEGEIGGIAADEVFFIHADGSQVELRVES